MTIYKGSQKEGKIYKGGTKIDKIYSGSTLVYQNYVWRSIVNIPLTKFSGTSDYIGTVNLPFSISSGQTIVVESNTTGMKRVFLSTTNYTGTTTQTIWESINSPRVVGTASVVVNRSNYRTLNIWTNSSTGGATQQMIVTVLN